MLGVSTFRTDLQFEQYHHIESVYERYVDVGEPLLQQFVALNLDSTYISVFRSRKHPVITVSNLKPVNGLD